MSRRLNRKREVAALIGLLLLPSASFAGILDQFLKRPLDISKNGHMIDFLLDRTILLVSIYFLIVLALLLWITFTYRQSEKHRTGYYFHGTDKKSMLLQAIVGLTVFFTVDVQLVYLSHRHLQDTYYNYPTLENPLRIEIMAQQWAWNIRYPGPDGRFNTPDDIITLNDMRIPVDRPIIIQLMAKDVIHSLFLPNVRLKQDAIPGRVTQFWFQCQESGDFEMVCAEMCGLNHYLMRGELRVLEKDVFDSWLRQAQKISKIGFDPQDKEALWGWEWGGA